MSRGLFDRSHIPPLVLGLILVALAVWFASPQWYTEPLVDGQWRSCYRDLRGTECSMPMSHGDAERMTNYNRR